MRGCITLFFPQAVFLKHKNIITLELQRFNGLIAIRRVKGCDLQRLHLNQHVKILEYLDVNVAARLSILSKAIYEAWMCDSLWQHFYSRKFGLSRWPAGSTKRSWRQR